MNTEFLAAMRRATSSTRAFDLAEATRVIQDAFAGIPQADVGSSTKPEFSSPSKTDRSKPFPIDPDAEVVEPAPKPAVKTGEWREDGTTSQRLRKPLGEALRILREGRAATGGFGMMPGAALPEMATEAPSVTLPAGAQFLARSFTCEAGPRSYKLYVPASAQQRPLGLVVMLHGCKQHPDDFAAGTGMNAVAEAHGLLVAYPRQSGTDNASSCWNWFRPSDQSRGAGEPAIIAGITKELMSEFNLDRSRVYIAGLSAGGAMAAIMAETYPDLYSAIGTYSGLPYGSASDVMSAFSIMRGDDPHISRSKARSRSELPVRTIVFQGAADRTVHPSNGDRIVAAATPTGANSVTHTENGRSAGGRNYTRTIVAAGPGGLPLTEHWVVHGAGHAWSGGRSGGSYTDPHGPDASTEMVRFFIGSPSLS